MIKLRTSERNGMESMGSEVPRGKKCQVEANPLFVHTLRCGRITALALNESRNEKKVKREDGGESITGKPRP